MSPEAESSVSAQCSSLADGPFETRVLRFATFSKRRRQLPGASLHDAMSTSIASQTERFEAFLVQTPAMFGLKASRPRGPGPIVGAKETRGWFFSGGEIDCAGEKDQRDISEAGGPTEFGAEDLGFGELGLGDSGL